MTVYLNIIKNNSVCDIVKFQCNLDNMQEWFRTWLLNLKMEKCKVMQVDTYVELSIRTSYKMEIVPNPGSSMELTLKKTLG